MLLKAFKVLISFLSHPPIYNSKIIQYKLDRIKIVFAVSCEVFDMTSGKIVENIICITLTVVGFFNLSVHRRGKLKMLAVN